MIIGSKHLSISWLQSPSAVILEPLNIKSSSSPAFLMMYSAYKLNKQGDNIQPCCTPFPIWNQSVVPFLVLIVTSSPAYTESDSTERLHFHFSLLCIGEGNGKAFQYSCLSVLALKLLGRI